MFSEFLLQMTVVTVPSGHAVLCCPSVPDPSRIIAFGIGVALCGPLPEQRNLSPYPPHWSIWISGPGVGVPWGSVHGLPQTTPPGSCVSSLIVRRGFSSIDQWEELGQPPSTLPAGPALSILPPPPPGARPRPGPFDGPVVVDIGLGGALPPPKKKMKKKRCDTYPTFGPPTSQKCDTYFIFGPQPPNSVIRIPFWAPNPRPRYQNQPHGWVGLGH
jgi:hypothetical protein